MWSFSEIKRLQEEEKTLVSLTSKFSDQLTRLKVEELALVSMLSREEEDDEDDLEIDGSTSGSIVIDSEHSIIKNEIVKNEPEDLDLAVQDPFSHVFEEEEDEEEEEEDDNNQLTSFLRELSEKQKKS